jgi:hypothetical protein
MNLWGNGWLASFDSEANTELMSPSCFVLGAERGALTGDADNLDEEETVRIIFPNNNWGEHVLKHFLERRPLISVEAYDVPRKTKLCKVRLGKFMPISTIMACRPPLRPYVNQERGIVAHVLIGVSGELCHESYA